MHSTGRNAALQRLHLGNNRLDAESTVPLATALGAFHALEDLALSWRALALGDSFGAFYWCIVASAFLDKLSAF